MLPSSGQMSDAVAVSLNHCDNYSAVVLLPYQLQNGNVEFGEAFAEKGDVDVFESD
jgi:hypothetical protein